MKKVSLLKINKVDTIPSIKAPGSKSEAIRYIIGAFLCKETSIIKGIPLSDDVLKAIDCVKAMGASVTINKDGYEASILVKGIDIKREKREEVTINIGSSATLFRLIAPISLMFFNIVKIYANKEFWKRPIDELNNFLSLKKYDEFIEISNFDIKNYMSVDGSISSQYASGLLFAQSILNDETELQVYDLKSTQYLNMTIDVLKDFGVVIQKNKIDNITYCNIKKENYKPVERIINGDYSQAAFFMVLGLFRNDINIINLSNSNQADEKIVDILKMMNARIEKNETGYNVYKSNLSFDGEIDVSECIDLAPILFVLATKLKNDIKFLGIRRLIYKESNRIEAIKDEFEKVGILMEVNNDECIIKPSSKLKNNIIFNCHNDHRICMAITVLSLINDIDCVIEGIECIEKSYPNFFLDLKKLGYEFQIEGE